MKALVYFNLKSQEELGKFVEFLTEKMAPALVKVGGQEPHLYEAVSDALSRYMLEVSFHDEAAAQAAMQDETIQSLNNVFLEFVQDVTLIKYQQVC